MQHAKKNLDLRNNGKNHEQSNKHKEVINRLRAELHIYGEVIEELPLNETGAEEKIPENTQATTEDIIVEKVSTETKLKSDKDTTQVPKSNKNKKDKRKKREDIEGNPSDEDDIEKLQRININKTKRTAMLDTDSDEEIIIPEMNTPANNEENENKLEEEKNANLEEEQNVQDTETKKKKPRRRKDKTQVTSPPITSPSPVTPVQNQNGETIETYACHVCSNSYETRNQLFIHIKATGHARAAAPEEEQATRVKKKKGCLKCLRGPAINNTRKGPWLSGKAYDIEQKNGWIS